jgi:pimeloyl-ACP methyl ester carboxylesterase
MTVRSVANRDAGSQRPVRRGYFECRYGQLHLYNAMPPGGGFEEATGLLCLHETPLTGRMFDGLQRILGRDRSVYAPDLPGYGQSDSPAERPTIQDYAAAIGDFLDTMRLRQIDVMGCQTGALIAAELAISRPQQVRRVVWTGVPIVNDAERAEFLRSPWPGAASDDGSHLDRVWRRVASASKLPLPDDIAARRVAAVLAGGANASWGMHACVKYPARERLRLVAQPLLLLRPADEFWESGVRVREFVPKARILDFPTYGTGLCEVAPEAVADAVTKFLHS